MLRNYFKIAVRNLLKRKGFSLINILGLATGMAVCLLIALFIRSELDYDAFLPNAQNIYRVALERKYPGRSTSYAIIPPGIGEAVGREYPQVLQSTRLFDFLDQTNFLVRIGDRRFEESRVLMADSNFFAVFKTPLLFGDPATALQKPFSAVLNETTAKKYFGSAALAIGKTFVSENETSYIITGIIADWPDNSHMTFDILIADAGTPFDRQASFTGFSAYTYLLLTPGSSPSSIEAGMPHIVDKYVSPVIATVFNMSYKQFLAAGNGYHYYLQPLTRIHLISNLEKEIRPNGSLRAIYIFSVIAVFILLIACINFINLSTARSMERAREVGIRKTFGSSKKMLIGQFLTESILTSLISLLLSLAMVALLLPLFNTIAEKNISVSWLLGPPRLALLFLFGTLVGLLAGFYPALVLSSFKSILVLKGRFKSNKYGLMLRNGLVVFQFAISVVLIICTIVVNRQMNYMMSNKLGFNKDNVIEIMESFLLRDKTITFKNELQNIPGVQGSSSATALPGRGSFFGATFQAVGTGVKEPMTGRAILSDEEFAALLQIRMKEGRFFSKEYLTDSLAVVLNERAVEELGLKNPVGALVSSSDPQFNAPDGKVYQYHVIGVISDFHFQSLHQRITPLVFANLAKFGNNAAYTAVRINSGNFSEALDRIAKKWKEFVPNRPFHFEFLDKNLARQYQGEQRTLKIFTIFSALAIFIACMGLMGLAAYATQLRTREISIRKVLGAGSGNIAGMLSANFLKLVSFSFLIAFPVAWWAMYNWLQQFAYRTGMPLWIFLTAGTLALLIAMVTVSFQAIKAALANPVNSLRTE